MTFFVPLMRLVVGTALLLGIGLTAPTILRAEVTAPGASVLRYGVYCAQEIVEHAPAEDTLSGVINLLPNTPPFVRRSHIVPARIGLGFGIHLDVLPGLAGPVVVETRHPPMGANGVTQQSWTTDVIAGDITLHGFTFEHDYEIVLGAWSISASQNGRLIYHVDFDIVDPGSVPPISCLGGLMS